MDNLYSICKNLCFKPKLCVEVGAAHITTSQLRDFVNNGVKCILFEASPRLFYCLQNGYNNDNGSNFMNTWPNHPEPPFDNQGWKDLPNVTIHNVAIFDKSGTINLFERNASTFVQGINSPAIVNDNYKENLNDATIVKCDTIDQYDNGEIDLLTADCEGCEIFALRTLKSRPYLICLETHGQNYKNPYLQEIEDWMKENNYTLAHQDNSDSLYIKSI